jgi:hypothetical protein
LVADHDLSNPDVTPGIGVLDGIRQDVREHLIETNAIRVDPAGLSGQLEIQTLILLCSKKSQTLHHFAQNAIEVDPLFVECGDIASNRGGHEEIIEQPEQASALMLHYSAGPLETFCVYVIPDERDRSSCGG